MAWTGTEWLKREKRGELIRKYTELIDAMAANQNRLTESELAELDEYLTELERLERIHRAERDLLYFAWEYFSETRNPGNPGNWDGFEPENAEDAPDFHKEICGEMDRISYVNKNGKVVVAAPRSHAKSTYLSKAEPLREIVYRLRSYIICISETPSVAVGNLEWIANQLKYNEKLRKDFGPLLHPKQQANARDNTSEFVAWEPMDNGRQRQICKVEAASTGQAIRGRNWNGKRPQLIILDDLEGKKNTNTAQLRLEMFDWFTKEVTPLGDPAGEKTAFIYMGTVVHADALLVKVMQRADFKTKRYKALIEEPNRTDLWEKCREIYLNVENPNRAKDAEAFYVANKAEMDEGTVVLWPEVQPIWKLMCFKWDNGSRAFNTEYQNNPIDEESAIFVPEKFRYYDESDIYDHYGRMIPMDLYAFWDIAQGKNRRSDYNAIVTVGRCRRTGVLYVLDAWAQKCQAHVALKVAVEKIIEYEHRAFAVETVGAQFDMYRQLQEELSRRNIYRTRIKSFSSKTKKEERIESLEPLIESGFLRFSRSHRLLLEQMEQFPGGTHDDLPDALAGAVDIAGGKRRRKKSYYKKPPGL
ncbi:phage terminase large subunit [Paenibacillus larvae]